MNRPLYIRKPAAKVSRFWSAYGHMLGQRSAQVIAPENLVGLAHAPNNTAGSRHASPCASIGLSRRVVYELAY